jgi:hypothetical protein
MICIATRYFFTPNTYIRKYVISFFCNQQKIDFNQRQAEEVIKIFRLHSSPIKNDLFWSTYVRFQAADCPLEELTSLLPFAEPGLPDGIFSDQK